MAEGCPERIDFKFMKYIWDFHKGPRQRNMQRIADCKDKSIIVFHKRSEAKRYLENIMMPNF